jgi:hypothetical protein
MLQHLPVQSVHSFIHSFIPLACAELTILCRSQELLPFLYRKQLNFFERKVYRRILGPVYDNEKKIGGYSPIKKFMQVLKNLL